MGMYLIKDTYKMLQSVWRQREKKVRMERFDIGGNEWGIKHRTDGLGAFTWAEVAMNYKQSYYMGLIFNIIISIICAILAAYLVFHKHNPQPVQQAAVSEEEYREVVRKERQAQAEKAGLLRRIEDLSAIRRNLSAQLRTQNANNAKLIAQLEALHVSVPAQPIILKGLYKEAATEKGLRQAVARSFGKDIAAHIQIKGE